MTDLIDMLQALGFRAGREQLNALLTHLTKSHASPVQTLEQIVALERREREVRNLASRSKKDRKSTRLNSSHLRLSRMPSSA